MYLDRKEKKGFVLIEVIIIINLLILVTIVSYKSILAQFVKSQYYYVKNDVMTLTVQEENLLNDVQQFINKNDEFKSKFLSTNEIESLNYTFNSKDSANLWFEIKNGKIYIVNMLYTLKSYRELKFIIEEEEDKNVRFVPAKYKTEYIK